MLNVAAACNFWPLASGREMFYLKNIHGPGPGAASPSSALPQAQAEPDPGSGPGHWHAPGCLARAAPAAGVRADSALQWPSVAPQGTRNSELADSDCCLGP